MERRVLQINPFTLQIIGDYSSICEASRVSGGDQSRISINCNYRRIPKNKSTPKNSYWRFYEDYVTISGNYLCVKNYDGIYVPRIYGNSFSKNKLIGSFIEEDDTIKRIFINKIADDEIFSPLINFETDYMISNYGRIINVKNLPIVYEMKQRLDKDGYPRIILSLNGKPSYFIISRLVGLMFCKRPNRLKNVDFQKLQVNHINEIKNDNRSCNLEWVTPYENILYGSGILKRSITQYKPVNVYYLDGTFLKRFKSCTEAGKVLGIGTGSISSAAKKGGVSRSLYKFKYI